MAGTGPLPLSGVVVARDEGDRIGRCLGSLAPICDELLVLDSGSRDDTVEIARAHGARVEYREWDGFSGQKNAVISRARNRWVLLLDADEWIGPDARRVIRNLFESGLIESADVWRQPRRMHFLGRPLRYGGFGSERIERLSRNTLRYMNARVHERPDLSAMLLQSCAARIEHDPVRSLPEYRAKLARYAELWAEQRHSDGRRCGPLAPGLHAIAGWLKGAIFKLGLLDGRVGWEFHACNFAYVHRKYSRLRELSR